MISESERRKMDLEMEEFCEATSRANGRPLESQRYMRMRIGERKKHEIVGGISRIISRIVRKVLRSR